MTKEQEIFKEMMTDTPDEPVTPILTDWQLAISRDQNVEDTGRVIRNFAKFWDDSFSQSFESTIPYSLRGRVSGREGFPDGSLIRTSTIVRVDRIKKGYKRSGPHDLLCATTQSGSKYYFYSDTMNAEMMLMVGEVLN